MQVRASDACSFEWVHGVRVLVMAKRVEPAYVPEGEDMSPQDRLLLVCVEAHTRTHSGTQRVRHESMHAHDVELASVLLSVQKLMHDALLYP